MFGVPGAAAMGMSWWDHHGPAGMWMNSASK